MVLGDGVGGPKKENGPETPSPWIIIALNNGSYIVMDNGVETLYGDSYSIKDEAQKQICKDGEWILLERSSVD